MERIEYILIGILACVVGLILFMAGYSAIRYEKTKNKWGRRFWISVAIVVALLTSTFSNYAQEKDKDQPKQEEKEKKQEKLTPEQEKKIKDLIKNLGDEKYETRESATKELIKLAKEIGRPVNPFIKEAIKSKDREVATRARMIWNEILSIEDRVAEIEKTKEWKELKKVWKKIGKILIKIEHRSPRGEISKLVSELGESKWARQKKRSPQLEDVPLLTQEEALYEVRVLTSRLKGHLAELYPKDIRKMCYDLAPPKPPVNKNLAKQKKLLEKQYKEGKITEGTYKKVKLALKKVEGGYVPHSFGYNLNSRNVALVFRLLKDLNALPKIDWDKVAPELKEKINDLIKKLGDDKFKVREDAQKALIEIGEPAIPALKKTLSQTKDPEVKERVKRILEGIE